MRELIERLEEEASGTENPYVSPHGNGFVIEMYHQRNGKVIVWRGDRDFGGFKNVSLGMKRAIVYKTVREAEKAIKNEVIPYIKEWKSAWVSQIHGWA